MIGLASGLLAIAGLLAERAVAIARADGVTSQLGIERRDRPAPTLSWRLLLAPAVLIAYVSLGPMIAGAGIAVTGLILHLVRRRRRASERHRATDQIADAVGALSAGLRAGLSLQQ